MPGAVEVVVGLEAEEKVSRDAEHVFDDEGILNGDTALVVNKLSNHGTANSEPFAQLGLCQLDVVQSQLDDFAWRDRRLDRR